MGRLDLQRFRGGGAVTEGAVGTDLVVRPPPARDEDLGFQPGVAAFPNETRVAPRAGAGFPRAVLPGAARCNDARGHADPRQPVADRGGGARWAGVGAAGGRWAPRDEARGEAGQSVVAAPPPGDVAAEALPACPRPRWPATGGAARLRSGRRRRRRTRPGGGAPPVAASARRPPARDGPAGGVAPAPVAPRGARVVPPACDGRASLRGAGRR